MNRQRVTPSNSITVALQTFRDIDRKKLEKAEAEASKARANLHELALELLKANPAYRQIKKLCENPSVKLYTKGYQKDRIYLLKWSDGLDVPKHAGAIRLTGNQRARAKRAFARLSKANGKVRKYRERTMDWKGRKMRFLKRRIEDSPDLRDIIIDICHIAFGSKPIPNNPCMDMILRLRGEDEKPAALPVSSGIDYGKMWESFSIGSQASPEGAASMIIDSFNPAWVAEFRKQLWIQAVAKEAKRKGKNRSR